MRTISLEELLEAGCHFGHQVTRQNPKARDFVYEARDNIHIIDLAKTKELLEEAAAFVKEISSKGGTMVMLGAKRQAAGVIKEEVERVQKEAFSDSVQPGLYTVTNRWIGGLFTNFSEVSKNFKRFQFLGEQLKSEQAKAAYTKKEISLWEKERQKLEIFYGGVATLTKVPDVLFVIDTHLEDLAVREARNVGVKIVGITDTNSDPTIIDYPIPANDDAVGSIKLVTNYIVDAWIEGKKHVKVANEKKETEDKKQEVKEDTSKKAEKKEPAKQEAKAEKPAQKKTAQKAKREEQSAKS